MTLINKTHILSVLSVPSVVQMITILRWIQFARLK
jgi:hypothetical protein